MINRRTKRIAAIAVGLSLIAAACGDDDDDGGEATTTETEAPAPTTAEPTEETTEETSAPTTEASAPEETSAPDTTEASEEAAAAAMTVTYTLSDTAVWNDGSPMSWEDFECTWLASLNTPESITTTGYNQITSVTAGATDKEVVVNFDPPFAAYKTLFAQPILKASEYADCNDVTNDFSGVYTYGNNNYIMTEWTPEQIVFEANEAYTG
ncbi:MAG TPA: ABC transporter substrate-binding protein, partial [Ilumatobacter sp.]|nr:ABC transporter substrate-binding protein [Ilumatobacter sp.]